MIIDDASDVIKHVTIFDSAVDFLSGGQDSFVSRADATLLVRRDFCSNKVTLDSRHLDGATFPGRQHNTARCSERWTRRTIYVSAVKQCHFHARAALARVCLSPSQIIIMALRTKGQRLLFYRRVRGIYSLSHKSVPVKNLMLNTCNI